MQITTKDAAAPADWEKVRPVLDETMGELADADRDAVALRFFEERSFAEIGRALQLSEEAARKLLGDAIKVLPCPRFEDVFRVLEEGTAEGAVIPIENTLATSSSLADHMMWQLSLLPDDNELRNIGAAIIGHMVGILFFRT